MYTLTEDLIHHEMVAETAKICRESVFSFMRNL